MRIQYLKEGSLVPPAFTSDAWPLEGDLVRHSWMEGQQIIEGRVSKIEWVSSTEDREQTDLIPSQFGPFSKITVEITLEDDDLVF